MIRVREPGAFGRIGQVVGFLLLWGGLNILLANWVLSDLLDAPRPIALATVAINFVIALFSELLLYVRPDRPIPNPTLAEGTTTNRNRRAVSYHADIPSTLTPVKWNAENSRDSH